VGPAMLSQVPVQRFKVRVRALAGHEAQLHQLAGGVVDEDQQRARLASLLEPAVIAAVDLDQLAIGLTSQPRLVETSPRERNHATQSSHPTHPSSDHSQPLNGGGTPEALSFRNIFIVAASSVVSQNQF
jgi:hypothetical protein